MSDIFSLHTYSYEFIIVEQYAYDSDSSDDQSENCLRLLFGEIFGKYFRIYERQKK